MAEQISIIATVPYEHSGKRLDQVAALLFPDYSRSRLQDWIKKGMLQVDEKNCKPKDKVFAGQQLLVAAMVEDEPAYQPEDMALNIIYEDDAILVINKPAGLVVHPAAGNYEGTLLNGLLAYCPDIAHLPRAGIVHRLDKDTTGLMVVAKTLAAHTDLVAQLQERTVKREYEAICTGVLTGGGTVDEPIGRHPTQRIKMAVVASGKEAITHYRVLERFTAHSYIRVKLETGRTHQIRVHMAHLHHPLLGDPVYGGRLKMPAGADVELQTVLREFRRQALHARQLGLFHPETGDYMEWQAPLPDDFVHVLQALRGSD